MPGLNTLHIRPASPNDIPVIRDLAGRIWPDAYLEIIGQAQIDYMLELMYSHASLAQQMNEGAQFLIAYEERTPVGFASFDNTEPGISKLHKLYVLPSQQGKGAGKKIVDHILGILIPAGYKALQLQVNRNNKAKLFYERLGFMVLKEIKLDIGGGFFMEDYVMEKRL